MELSRRKLVSDGKTILGIASGNLPQFYLIADFRRRHGFLILPSGPLCSFSDGSFKSTTHQAKLVQVEEALLESRLDPQQAHNLFKIVSQIVHHAENQKHGCTVIIDLNDPPVNISGQQLTRRLDLEQPDCLELAKSLSKVDGALHIGTDSHLHRFACLLDGRTVASEDRARGARYNSALRFTTEHKDILVVVVSADRPVSIIQEGVELSAQCQWKPDSSCTLIPPTLKEWIRQSGP